VSSFQYNYDHLNAYASFAEVGLRQDPSFDRARRSPSSHMRARSCTPRTHAIDIPLASAYDNERVRYCLKSAIVYYSQFDNTLHRQKLLMSIQRPLLEREFYRMKPDFHGFSEKIRFSISANPRFNRACLNSYKY